MENDIITVTDHIEIHPASRGYAVVRDGAVYGTYESLNDARELAEELARTAELIWDRDHGTENEGYYARLHHADGQEEDIALDADTAEEARAEFSAMYPSAKITRCDEAPDQQ